MAMLCSLRTVERRVSPRTELGISLPAIFVRVGLGSSRSIWEGPPPLPKDNHPLGFGCKIRKGEISDGFTQCTILIKKSGKGGQSDPRLFLYRESYDGFQDWNKMGWLKDS